MSDLVIKAENLSKIYNLYEDPLDRMKEALHPLRKKYHKDFYALNNINFEIKKGETVGLIGKNGAGKSTLLKLLTGVLNPTSGHVSVNGRVLALLELGAGFNPELTGIENIYFNGALFGASKEEISSKLQSILDFADIGHFVHQPIKTYSSGMVVRLAFAIIANMEPEILIVDEALAVGDVFFAQKCMRFLRNFVENGTLLFVSHDMGAVLSLCSRAIWLSEGEVKIDGSPKKISEAYLEDLYAGQQTDSREGPQSEETLPSDGKDKELYDMRMDFVNTTTLRNDIEVFRFEEPSEDFGHGSAKICDVFLEDLKGKPLSWVVGGELVRLVVHSQVLQRFDRPIVGFLVKNHLGQIIFGDNTFLTYVQKPLSARQGQRLEATFKFQMPVMPVGDYSISVAIAEGTQQEHIQHHWIHDALFFKVHASHVCHGLVGVAMNEINLRSV